MKKNYRLQGLDCAHCADDIERAINKIEGVKEATVSFMTTKLIIEAEAENISKIEEKMKKVVKKLDSDIVIKKD